MKNVCAYFLLRFYAELPDDDEEADVAFDAMGDDILARLNNVYVGDGIVVEFFSIEDGNTEPDE